MLTDLIRAILFFIGVTFCILYFVHVTRLQIATNMRGNKNETGEGDNNVEYSFKTVVLLDLPLQG